MSKNKIQKKFYLMVAGAMLILGLVTIFIVHTVLLKNIYRNEMELVTYSVTQQARILSSSFTNSGNLAKTVAKDINKISFIEGDKNIKGKEVNKDLHNYGFGLNIDEIYLVDKDGVVRAVTEGFESEIGQNFKSKIYFEKAIGGENYSEVRLGMVSKKIEYYFSSPMVSNEKNIGVVVVKMSPDVVYNFLQNVDINLLSNLMIVDGQGVVIGSKKDGKIYKSLGKISEESKNKFEIQDRFEGTIIDSFLYNYGNEDLLDLNYVKSFNNVGGGGNEIEKLVLKRIGDFDFYLVGEVDIDSMVDKGKKVGLILGLVIMGTVAMMILMIFLIIKKQFEPLEKVLIMSRNISVGNFEDKNTIKGNDEFAELGSMLEKISESMTHRYDELEKMVSDRTIKLTEQTRAVEKTKLAVTNILDDVEAVAADLEKFKMAVENASDHIVITDPDGVILYANKAVETITGFSREEVVGTKAGDKKNWGGLMPVDVYQNMWKTIKLDKKLYDGEATNQRKNGQTYIASVNITPVLNRRDDVVYFVGIERDITKEKEVDRNKTDFIYLTSHQLRTPLSAMKWFCEMLLSGDGGELNKEQKEFVTNISQSNERMISLINSLLNISRIESGRIIIDPEPTDLGKLVADVLSELKNKLDEKKQKVTVLIADNLPKISVDPKLIREVYKNLLTNANKYTQKSGKISIDISIKGKEVVSEISDNGLGIPKDGQEKIFSRFYRAENILKLETEGTGLGLYLAKAIVESSKGKIWFKSIEKKGTTFWFTLPLEGVKANKGEVSIND